MAGNRTLTIIKPLAVASNHTANILQIILKNGFKIVAMKQLQLTAKVAGAFYEVHRGKEFYEPLVQSMTIGPVIVAILEKDNAVDDYRKLMGNTDPQKADEGTIRRQFGVNIRENAVHGSDCDINSEKECNFFFSSLELL